VAGGGWPAGRSHARLGCGRTWRCGLWLRCDVSIGAWPVAVYSFVGLKNLWNKCVGLGRATPRAPPMLFGERQGESKEMQNR
jgi:hypothetical protein